MKGDKQLLVDMLVRLLQENGVQTLTWHSGGPNPQLHINTALTLSRAELYALQRALGRKVGR